MTRFLDWLFRRCPTCHGAGVVRRWGQLLTDEQYERLKAAMPHTPELLVVRVLRRARDGNAPALVSRCCYACDGSGRGRSSSTVNGT